MTINNFLVHTFYYTHNSYETMLKSLKSANVGQIELYGSAPLLCEMYEYTGEERTSMLKEKKELLEQYGIKIRSIFIPTLDCPVNIADENDEVRAFSLSFVKKYIEDAAYLGAFAVLLDSGYGLFDKDKSPAWNRAAEALKEIVGYAEDMGITVYIRPMGKCTNLVDTAVAMAEMMKTVGSASLKPCLDIGIMEGNGETVEDYTSRFGDIDYIRIPNFGPEGEICEGIGIHRITDVVEKVPGFNGDIVIEIGWERLDIPDSASAGIGKMISKFVETL